MKYKRWRKKEIKRLQKAIDAAERATKQRHFMKRRWLAIKAQAEINRQELIKQRAVLEEEIRVEKAYRKA